MSFFDKTKEKMSEAAHATKVSAQKTKLKLEIEGLKSDIKKRKEKFGIEAFDAFERKDQAKITDLYDAALNQVKEYQKRIEEKENEIKNLK